MSGTNKTVPSSKGTSTLVRPKFAPGMLLQHEDLDQLSAYTRELNRLMFRSLFGCGVICGLVVKPGEHCGQAIVTIGSGVALDCAGDPIHVPKEQRIVIEDDCLPSQGSPLWVVLCATVRCCAPRTSLCPSDDDDSESVCTRERDGFEIRVLPERPKCACSCVDEEDDAGQTQSEGQLVIRGKRESDCYCVDPTLACYQDHYAGICGCTCDDCSGGAGCNCVILARLDRDQDREKGTGVWSVDHSVRRFIRPVLMRDPQVAEERFANERKKRSGEVKPNGEEAAAKQTVKSARAAAKTPKG
jgi:hypothetical protein